MATEATAKDTAEEVDGNAESERERSTISFPYGDLEFALTLVKAVQAVGGSSAGWDQAAAQLQMEPKAGGFRIKAISAKIFGLVTYSGGTINLTSLGLRICDSKGQVSARAEAFLKVPLYSRIFEKFKGTSLPPPEGLEAEMVTLGVAKKQKDKARQTFQRSAQQAGFFWAGTGRMVMPKGSSAAPVVEDEMDQANTNADETEGQGKKKSGGNGGADGGGGRHPFIAGLLKELPAEGSEWETEDRVKWLQAANMIFNLIYKTGDSGKSVTVSIGSAK